MDKKPYRPNPRYAGGKRKDPTTVPGYNVSENKEPLLEDKILKEPIPQENDVGCCKHRMLLGTCTICNALAKDVKKDKQ